MPDSPQAIIAPLFPKLQIKEPDIRDLVADTPTEIYNKATEPNVVRMFIHNIGVNPVVYSLNQNVTQTVYHDGLAACASAGDFLGTKEYFDFKEVGLNSISVASYGAVGKLAIIKYVKPSLGL